MQRASAVFLCLVTSLAGASAFSWSSWGSWTTCSRTCTSGTQYRVRFCNGGVAGSYGCFGQWWETRGCYINFSCTTTTSTTTTTATTTTTTPEAGSCYDNSDKDSYRGTVSQTETGIFCQAWSSQYPHQHKFTPDRYPSSDLTGNLCRNPDSDVKPWCFTTSTSKQWDFCSVPSCSGYSSTTSKPAIAGTNPPTGTSDCGNPDVPMSDEIFGDTPQEIVGGVETTPGSIPWQASLRRSFGGSHFCGASLLNENWIVTASHCISEPQNPSSYYAILGDHLQYVKDDTEQRVDFSAIFLHEEFDSRTLANDITLMKMKTPISYNTYIRPVCLPPENRILPDNDMVTVSGWGTTKGTGSNAVLRRAAVPVVENGRCSALIGGIESTMLCAGYMEGGKDSCQGDSGGPLVWKSVSGNYQLVGIVSWGYGCAEARKPGVYTRVSNYIGWINNIIHNH